MLRILSLGLAALILVGVTLSNISYHAMIDIPSGAIVFGGTLTIVGGTHGLAGISLLMRAQLSPVAAPDLPHLRAAMRTGVRAAWLTSGIGVLIAAVQILPTLGHIIGNTAIVPGIAVTLLTLLYAGLLHLFAFLPLERHFTQVQG